MSGALCLLRCSNWGQTYISNALHRNGLEREAFYGNPSRQAAGAHGSLRRAMGQLPHIGMPPDSEVQDHLRWVPLSCKTKPKPLVNPQ